MLTYLRYSLATVCFALSVACLALWWRSASCRDVLIGPTYISSNKCLFVDSLGGIISLTINDDGWAASGRPRDWKLWYPSDTPWQLEVLERRIAESGLFGPVEVGPGVYFPLWFPALVFAFAGVAALRLGSRFTLRSAIIATAIAAGLLGMAAAL